MAAKGFYNVANQFAILEIANKSNIISSRRIDSKQLCGFYVWFLGFSHCLPAPANNSPDNHEDILIGSFTTRAVIAAVHISQGEQPNFIFFYPLVN